MDKPHAACDMHTDDFLLLLFHSPKRHTASITHIDNVGALLRFVEQTSQIHPSMFMVGITNSQKAAQTEHCLCACSNMCDLPCDRITLNAQV